MFEDRHDAGRRLAAALVSYRASQPVVLGLARGGVVVAYEVAMALGAPLDVLVARKLGVPHQPELALGAIAPGEVLLLEERTVRVLGMTEAQLQHLVIQEAAEMKRRIRTYRGTDDLPSVTGRSVILVDDGLATGLTALAAIAALRKGAPRRLVLAVPVSAPDTAGFVSEQVDDFVCLLTPEDFMAVGTWYAHFDPVTDDEVMDLLNRARTRSA